MQIGTLNEGALHAQLKEWYRRPGDLLEQVAGGFVVDLVRGDLLVEMEASSRLRPMDGRSFSGRPSLITSEWRPSGDERGRPRAAPRCFADAATTA